MSAKVEGSSGTAQHAAIGRAAEKTGTAKQGETVPQFAERHRVDVGDLIKANPHIRSAASLHGGMELVLPHAGATARSGKGSQTGAADEFEPRRKASVFEQQKPQLTADGLGTAHLSGARQRVPLQGADSTDKGVRSPDAPSGPLMSKLLDEVKGLDSDGDKLSMSIGASVSVAGAQMEGQVANVEVTRVDVPGQPPQYVLSMGSELAVGLSEEMGVKVKGSEVGGQATAGGGMKMEITLNSPEEVIRAIEILNKEAASSMIADQLKVPGAGPSQADKDFLLQHGCAIEYTGEIASEVAASWGHGGVGEVGVSGGHAKETTLRIELPPAGEDGKRTSPVTVTLSEETTVEGGVDLAQGVKLEGKDGDESGAKKGVGGGSVSVSVTNSSSVELPPDLAGSLLEDPVGTLKNAPGQLGQVSQSTTVTLRGEGGVFGKGGGAELQVSIGAEVDPETRARALEQLSQGNIEGFMKELGDSTTFEYRAESFSTRGSTYAPEVSILGYGAGLEAQYTREDHGAVRSGEMSGTEMIDELQRFLKGYAAPGR